MVGKFLLFAFSSIRLQESRALDSAESSLKVEKLSASSRVERQRKFATWIINKHEIFKDEGMGSSRLDGEKLMESRSHFLFFSVKKTFLLFCALPRFPHQKPGLSCDQLEKMVGKMSFISILINIIISSFCGDRVTHTKKGTRNRKNQKIRKMENLRMSKKWKRRKKFQIHYSKVCFFFGIDIFRMIFNSFAQQHKVFDL